MRTPLALTDVYATKALKMSGVPLVLAKISTSVSKQQDSVNTCALTSGAAINADAKLDSG